jgi:sortase A
MRGNGRPIVRWLEPFSHQRNSQLCGNRPTLGQEDAPAHNTKVRTALVFAMVLSGFACLAWSGYAILTAWSYQRTERAALERARVEESPTLTRTEPPPAQEAARTLSTGETIGSLEIPRLGFSAIVAEGDDDGTLKIAVGHLPDTPLPWNDGNSAMAGHRDGLFRPLEKIRVGDELNITTPRGDLRYRVSETKVVDPNDLSVLDAGERPMLTLITCFPFHYIGPAPRRFIVHAEAIDRTAAPHGM